LYAADFGENPRIHTFDGTFKPVDVVFDNPFDDNKNGKVDAGLFSKRPPADSSQVKMLKSH
jgi:hypothetical protein